MARPPSTQPTDGELEILRVLWVEGPMGLSVLCRQLRRQREVATTTVATMLRIMQDKGLVRRQGAGRGARWVAAVTHQKTARKMVGKLLDDLFDGSADRLVAHLVAAKQLSDQELAELRKLVAKQPKTVNTGRK